MTPDSNIKANAQILRTVQAASASTIDASEIASLAHAKSQGVLKMNAKILEERLRLAINSQDVLSELESLTKELREAGADLRSVRSILLFMEQNPQADLV